MSVSVLQHHSVYLLRAFGRDHATTISRWVTTAQQMRWLAPSTQLPLTTEKILGWKKPGGQAFVYLKDNDPQPVGYGELNPMRRHLDQLWIGHVIIRPDQRGLGCGRKLVQALLFEAFHERFASCVTLVVFPDNTPAVQCYLDVGFTITGDEHHQFGGVGPKHRLLRLEIKPDQYESRREQLLHSAQNSFS